MQEASSAPVLAFGEFVLDIANARLTQAGRARPLSRKPLALLVELVRRPGLLVPRDHLLDTVWQRRFVSDSAVKSVISELRAALGDDARAPRWIETVPGRGLRFIGTVSPLPPSGRAVPAPGHLPVPATALIGREAELADLQARLAGDGGAVPAARLLTLTGPAGVGKSLLALVLAHTQAAARADGAWFVDAGCLRPEDGAPLLRGTLARVLRLSDMAAVDDGALARSLQGTSMLLVIDNADPVIDALAPLLAAVLAQAGQVQCLVTSREPLHVAGEQVHRVPPLEVPAEAEQDPQRITACSAARLLVARVQARQPGFVVEPAQAAALSLLCRALDGLPLALELAAARVPTLGLGGIVAQLGPADTAPGVGLASAALRLLDRAPGRTPAGAAVRYRTLREALDWSHVLLDPLEQRVLRRLSVFQGPFDVAAAQRVAASADTDALAVLGALEALVERSWLAASADEPRRLRLLQGPRACARQHLVDAGEEAATLLCHFDAVLERWQRADVRALGDPALQWVQQHEDGLPDLRAALAWGSDAVCRQPPLLEPAHWLALVGASGLLWHRAGCAREGLRWCEHALALAGDAAGEGPRAGVDLTVAHLAGIAMMLPAPRGLLAARRAAAAYQAAGDVVRETYARYLEHTLMIRAEPQAARGPVLARLAVLQQPSWGALLRRFERSATAYEARLQGDHAAYLAFNQAELARSRALGATWEAWSAAIGLMLALHDGGRLAEAVEAGREVIDEIRAAGRLRQNANRLAMWALMLAEAGDVAATRAVLAEAVGILQGAGRLGMLLPGAAWLALHEGRPAHGARLLARFDAPGGTGTEFAPGTFVRRSVATLWGRLRSQLDDGQLAELRAQGGEGSEAEALRECWPGELKGPRGPAAAVP